MSVLANTVQANPQSYFFALAGGGGSGTTLQSPASVAPDGTGTTTLSLQANQAGGSAAVAVQGGTSSSGAVTVGGFGSTYRMGVVANTVSPAPSIAPLTIGLNSSATPALTYDGGNGSLILGDGGNGTIQTRNALFVSDITTSGANQLGLSPINATTSVISQNIAQGTVAIGSSTANAGTLTVSDVPKNGAANYIEVNGASGQVPLFISGAQGVGGVSYIYPDASGVSSALFLGASRNTEDTVAIQQTAEVSFVDIGGNGGQGVRLRGVPAAASVQTGIISSTAGASGQLQLQGSSGSANAILISDTTATFDHQIVQQVPGTTSYPAATVLANATYTSGTSADFSIGTFAPGLYMCMIRVNQVNVADPTTMANMGSGLVYLQTSPLDPTKTIVVGGGTFGNGNVGITSIVTAGVGADTMRLVVTTGNVYVNVKMWQLTDVLPGMSS